MSCIIVLIFSNILLGQQERKPMHSPQYDREKQNVYYQKKLGSIQIDFNDLNIRNPYGFEEIKVGGELGRRIDLTIEENILKLNYEQDFLNPFRTKFNSIGPYMVDTVHNHFIGKDYRYIGLGKNLDAVIKLAAYSQGEKIIQLKKFLVQEVLQTADQDGYIGVFLPGERFHRLWDIHEQGYIISALLNDYRIFNNVEARTAAIRLGDWLIDHYNPAIPVSVSHIGTDHAFFDLYSVTNNQKYLDFIKKNYWKSSAWDDYLGKDYSTGLYQLDKHIYTSLSFSMSQHYMYQYEKDPSLLLSSDAILHFIKNNGMRIPGICGNSESWKKTQSSQNYEIHDGLYVNRHMGETCVSVYSMLLLDLLLRESPKAYYGDLMERILYNVYFAAQSPDGRRLRYFTDMEGKREYFYRDTYCCPSNFRRYMSMLPGTVYYQYKDSVMINLYCKSQVKLRIDDDKVIEIKQETDYPNSGKIKITITPQKESQFNLRLRIPKWCQNPAVTINGGKTIHYPEPGTLFSIDQKWKKENIIELDLPMQWRWIRGRMEQEGKAALMRGPVVFCLNPARNMVEYKLTDSYMNFDHVANLVIDPFSLSQPGKDTIIRPDGLSVLLKSTEDEEILFTEFTDPHGQKVYFRLSEPTAAVNDPLFNE